MARAKLSKIDSLINRWFSKKLIVFTIATIFLINGILQSEQWLYITLLYIGGQQVSDILMGLKHGPLFSSGSSMLNKNELENSIEVNNVN